MDTVIADDIATAWLEAATLLAARPGNETWDLVVEIRQPGSLGSEGVRQALDHELSSLNKQSIETVANTIFPQLLWESSRGDRERLYSRYQRMVSKLRRFPQNHRGVYFERLISWPPGATDGRNQVESVVQRLQKQLAQPRPLRFVYDLALFSPINDALPRGFPCLSYINVKIGEGRLRMTAHYRNHYFVERAFGNYLGLARLQAFIAHAANIEAGNLICVSGHAWLDHPISGLVSRPSIKQDLAI